jgi:hypothetical protein
MLVVKRRLIRFISSSIAFMVKNLIFVGWVERSVRVACRRHNPTLAVGLQGVLGFVSQPNLQFEEVI